MAAQTANLTLPPGPGGIGLMTILRRARDPLGFLKRLEARYGGIVSFRTLLQRTCVVFDADLIQQVLLHQHSSFEKGPFAKSLVEHPTTGTAEGEDHRRMRSLVRPLYIGKAIAGYAQIMLEASRRMQSNWRDGDVVDIATNMHVMSQNVVSRTFFGQDTTFDPKLVDQMVKSGGWLLILTMLPFRSLVEALPLPQNRRLKEQYSQFDAVVQELIKKARSADGEKRTDLVSLLTNSRGEEDSEEPLTDEEIRDETLIQLFAGYETVATGMAWAFYHLSRNPEARKKLEREVDEVLGGRAPTAEDFRQLPYSRAVFDEALRLNPPLYIIGRQAKQDCVIGGYRIPKGTVVQPVLMAPHQKEGFYPAADVFSPERWLTRKKTWPRSAYVPFSAGPRACIGTHYARLEAMTTLVTVTQRWRLDVIAAGPPAVGAMILYRFKNGLPVRISARKDAPAPVGS